MSPPTWTWSPQGEGRSHRRGAAGGASGPGLARRTRRAGGFAAVVGPGGTEGGIACFAMVCHHCGSSYVEFSPNARQENLLIGMVHAFMTMGVPDEVLTDNTRSVVVRRDLDGRPVWQRDYAESVGCVGFRTRPCKPRHPLAKGKVERPVRFARDNLLAGRDLADITAPDEDAALWCAEQAGRWRRAVVVRAVRLPSEPRGQVPAHMQRRPLPRARRPRRHLGPAELLVRHPAGGAPQPAGHHVDCPGGALDRQARLRRVRLRVVGLMEEGERSPLRAHQRGRSEARAPARGSRGRHAGVRPRHGGAELGALAATFDYLAEKGRRASTETLPEPSGLPTRGGSTFDGFDFPGTRCRDAGALAKLVKPSCLIVDEVGRCVFDRACTDLFFDVIDRRYEKEGPNTMIPASNVAPSSWDEFLAGDEALLCALDRVFDKASVFMMRGPSYRSRGLDTYSVEAVPQATKVRGMQPK